MTLSFDLHYTLNSYMNSVLQPIVNKICEICSENNFKDYTSVLPEIFKVITYSTDSAATNIDTLKNGTLSVSVDDPADTTFHSIKIVDSVVYAYLTYDPNFFMSWFTLIDQNLKPAEPLMMPLVRCQQLPPKLGERITTIINKASFTMRIYPHNWMISFAAEYNQPPLVICIKSAGPSLMTAEELAVFENNLLQNRTAKLTARGNPKLPTAMQNITNMDDFHTEIQQQGGAAAADPHHNQMETLINIFSQLNDRLAEQAAERGSSPTGRDDV